MKTRREPRRKGERDAERKREPHACSGGEMRVPAASRMQRFSGGFTQRSVELSTGEILQDPGFHEN